MYINKFYKLLMVATSLWLATSNVFGLTACISDASPDRSTIHTHADGNHYHEYLVLEDCHVSADDCYEHRHSSEHHHHILADADSTLIKKINCFVVLELTQSHLFAEYLQPLTKIYNSVIICYKDYLIRLIRTTLIRV